MAPMRGGGRRDQGDRPGGARDDASLIAVFLPVAFMGGIVGPLPEELRPHDGVRDRGVDARQLHAHADAGRRAGCKPLRAGAGRPTPQKSVLERIVDCFYRPLERGYMKVLRFVMRHRWIVVVLPASLALVSTVPLVKAVEKGFLPKSDEAQFEVNVRAPEGTSLEADRADRRAHRAQDARARRRPQHAGHDRRQRPAARRTWRASTCASSIPASASRPRTRSWTRCASEVLAQAAARTCALDVSEVPLFNWRLRARRCPVRADRARPRRAASATPARRRPRSTKVPGAVDVDSTLIAGKPELQISIDRERAADLGVQVADIADDAAHVRRRRGGVDLRGGRRAVRGARARRRALPRQRRRRWRC